MKAFDTKKQIVETTVDQIKSADSNVYVFDYSQITANQMNEIRRSMQEKGVEVKVVKNTLITRITKTFGIQYDEELKGQNLMLVPGDDFIAPLKDLFKFIKDNSKGKFKLGLLNGKYISDTEIENLSKLPPKEALIAQVLGTMQSPVRGFAVVLNGVQSNFVRALSAIKDQKSGS